MRKKLVCAGVAAAVMLIRGLLLAQTPPELCSTAVRSPDGRYEVSCNALPPPCAQCGVWLANGTRKQLLFVPNEPPSVSWAPDSHAFFINDRQSSDFATSYVYAIATAPQRWDLYQSVSRYLAANQRRGEAHVYAEALGWRDNQHLLLQVRGHSDQAPAREFLSCFTIDTGARTVTRTFAAECAQQEERLTGPIPSRQAVTEDLSRGATFTLNIRANLPPYTFKVIPEPGGVDEWGNPHSTVRAIEVFRGDSKTPLQRLTGCDFAGMETPPNGADWFRSADLNFDGYNDLYMLTSWGATGNQYGCVWLFNPATGRFDYSKDFSELTAYALHPESKTITTFDRGGMLGYVHTAGRYKVENNRPVLVWTDHQDWDFEKKQFHCIVQERRGTAMVVTHDGWSGGEDGDPACDPTRVFANPRAR